jgi:hypothetical protein
MFEKEARAMKDAGFFTLNYFNVTEMGTRIKSSFKDGVLTIDAPVKCG